MNFSYDDERNLFIESKSADGHFFIPMVISQPKDRGHNRTGFGKERKQEKKQRIQIAEEPIRLSKGDILMERNEKKQSGEQTFSL